MPFQTNGSHLAKAISFCCFLESLLTDVILVPHNLSINLRVNVLRQSITARTTASDDARV